MCRTVLLRPNEVTQREVLSAAVAELLWRAGDRRRAVIAIPEVRTQDTPLYFAKLDLYPQSNPVFDASVRFSMDGVTEKVVYNLSQSFWSQI